MKVLIATEKPFAPVAVKGISDELQAAGLEVVLLEKYTEKQQLLDAVADVEAIIIRSDIIDKEVLEAAKALKIVVRAGAGYDNVDLEAATAHNVVVMNTPGQNANAVAELVLGMMLYAARNFFTPKAGTELRGKSVGIVAFGNIGRLVAGAAKGIGMNVYAYHPRRTKEQLEAAGVESAETLETLFTLSDYISLHLPSRPDTKGIINYDLLKTLRPNAVIINTARKEIIDETALLRILEERPDVKYLTDVQPGCHAELTEKYPDRYFATPKKMGAQTFEANVNAGLAAGRQIIGYLLYNNKEFQVN